MEFADFAAKQPWTHQNSARALAEVFASEHLRVLHYDSCKGELISHFAQAVGLELNAALQTKYNSLRVNRSLTAAEREILLSINQRHGTRFSKRLSNFLIANPDTQTQPVPCPRETGLQLLEKHREDVRFINDRFFSGQPVVSVGFRDGDQGAQERPTLLEEKARVLGSLLEWTLLSLSEAETKVRQLEKVEQSALAWQERSWFKRAFNRWRAPR